MVLHTRWFVDGAFPVRFEDAFTVQTAVPVAIALAITAAVVVLWRAIGRRPLLPGPTRLGMSWTGYERLLSWMPWIVGFLTAVPLLTSGLGGQLFATHLVLPGDTAGRIIASAQIVIALSFIFGVFTRAGAALLGLLWVLGIVLFSPTLMLENAVFAGIAFYIFVMNGDLFPRQAGGWLRQAVAPLVPYAVPVLRIMGGVSLVVLAFTEKLLNMPIGLAFLQEYPFNVVSALGFGWLSDQQFLLAAATVELTFGALLISGAFTRLVVALLFFPFTMAFPLLGWVEFVGHLPYYGVIALLLVSGERRTGRNPAADELLPEEEAEQPPVSRHRRPAATMHAGSRPAL